MDEPISATNANRYFSALIRGVQEGQSYVVTSHGRPVARIIPVSEDADAARPRFFEWLDSQPALNLGRWKQSDGHLDAEEASSTK